MWNWIFQSHFFPKLVFNFAHAISMAFSSHMKGGSHKTSWPWRLNISSIRNFSSFGLFSSIKLNISYFLIDYENWIIFCKPFHHCTWSELYLVQCCGKKYPRLNTVWRYKFGVKLFITHTSENWLCSNSSRNASF